MHFAQSYGRLFRWPPTSRLHTQLDESLHWRVPLPGSGEAELWRAWFQVSALAKLTQMGFGCVRSSGSTDPHGVGI